MPLVPAKAGTHSLALDIRLRGYERSTRRSRGANYGSLS